MTRVNHAVHSVATRRPQDTASVRRAGLVAAAAFTAAIAATEVLGATAGAPAAAVVDAFVAAIAVGYAASGPEPVIARLVAVLALIAVGRTLSVVLPFGELPQLSWYALSSLPILTGGILAARLFEDPRVSLRLHIVRPRLDIVIAALGVPAGIVGWWILRPPAVIDAGVLEEIVVAAAVLMGVAATAEELLFRGLLLGAVRPLVRSDGRASLYVVAMTGAVYLGAGPIGYCILMVALAAVLSIALGRGASLWAAIACRGLVLVTMAILAG